MGKELVSQKNVDKARTQAVKGLKSAFAIDCYKSETDNEIGRSDEHAKHMRRTRRKNFARKMKLIDPHYGKKAAGVLAAGTALGLATTSVPAVGPVLGPSVGGAVIAGGLAFLETDAHRSVGDHAILDSLLDDRDDNWRTNTSLHGFDGHGDRISDFDRQQMLHWSDSDEDDLDDLISEDFGGRRQAAVNTATSNPLFDSMDSQNSMDDLFSGINSVDLNKSTSSRDSAPVPRPPSPVSGQGERTTNPHSSAAVQSMGNDFLSSAPPKSTEDDFFSFMSQNSTPSPASSFTGSFGNEFSNQQFQQSNQPLNQTPQQAPAEVDFFADFNGSASASQAKPQPANQTQPRDINSSLFSAMASAIPSSNQSNQPSSGTPMIAQPPRADNDDPFADLYARATSTPGNMRSF